MAEKNLNEDIDSKIADFMADIDEIVLGKKPNNDQEESEWKQCFDETSQSAYYWNTKTNECSWEPPPIETQNMRKKRPQITTDNKSPKKLKKPTLIAEYTSSESESSEEEENVDDIDELLNGVLDKKEKHQTTDLYPTFETDCRAAIARLIDLGDKSAELFSLRVQLETRLEDCLAGYLSKSYAANKLEQALIQIEQFETLLLPPTSESVKQPLTTSEMALLLSLPPPPPPPSPPPPASMSDETLQLFYAQLNCDQSEPMSSNFDAEKPCSTKSEHHHHHHKDKKSKPAKTLPTNLIQKWTHARQELHGIADIDDS